MTDFYEVSKLCGTIHNSQSYVLSVSFLFSTEKPYIVKHPEDKVRYEGGRVQLCCKATGSPAPDKYYWWDEYKRWHVSNHITTQRNS